MKNIIFRKLNNKAIIPKYQSKFASGFDLCCIENERVVPNQIKIIKTGLAVELPESTELQIRPRSGLSLKYGNYISNSPGTVDEDYRGEIGIIIINNTKKDILFTTGERIAQGIISPVERCIIKEAEELTGTDRGSGGFGHTGNE